MTVIRTVNIYVNKNVMIRDDFLKPKGVRERKKISEHCARIVNGQLPYCENLWTHISLLKIIIIIIIIIYIYINLQSNASLLLAKSGIIFLLWRFLLKLYWHCSCIFSFLCLHIYARVLYWYLWFSGEAPPLCGQ